MMSLVVPLVVDVLPNDPLVMVEERDDGVVVRVLLSRTTLTQWNCTTHTKWKCITHTIGVAAVRGGIH